MERAREVSGLELGSTYGTGSLRVDEENGRSLGVWDTGSVHQ